MAKTYYLDNQAGTRQLAVSDPADSTDTATASNGGGTASQTYIEPSNTAITRTSTGSFSVEVNISSAQSNTTVHTVIHRVNSSNVSQASAAAATQSSATTGLKTFSYSSPALGTWASTDKLRVDVVVTNNNAHGGAVGPTWDTGTTNAEVVTPFSSAITQTVNQVTDTNSPLRVWPVVNLSYNSNGATDGVTVTTSDTFGDSWDTVTIAAGNELTYDTALAYEGDASIFHNSSTGANSNYKWTQASITGAPAESWARVYSYITASGIGTNSRTITFLDSSATVLGAVTHKTDGKISIVDAASSIQATTTNSFSTDAWHRVEAYIRPGASTSDGYLEVRLYNTPSSSTPTETISFTGNFGVAAPEQVRFGTAATGATQNLDGHALSTGGWIGPLATGQTVAVGQVTETDTAQTFAAKLKVKAIGLNTETDTAQTVTPVRTYSVGQVTETDTAQTLNTTLKVKAIGLNTETDTATHIIVPQFILTGQATETDTANTVTPSSEQIIAVGLVTETDTSSTIVVAKTKSIGLVTETDTVTAIVRGTHLSFSAEGGAPGATVTTGDSGNGDEWDTVSVAGSNVFVYSTNYAIQGSQSIQADSAGAANANARWDTSVNNHPEMWARTFVYVESGTGVGGNVRMISFFNSSSTLIGSAVVHSDGTIKIQDSTGSNLATTSASYNLDGWFRLEAYANPDTATTGTITARLYNDPEGTLTEEISVSNGDLGTLDVGEVRFGIPVKNSQLYFDAAAVASDTWVGGLTSGGTLLQVNAVTNNNDAQPITVSGGGTVVLLNQVIENDSVLNVNINIQPVGPSILHFDESIVDGAGFQNVLIRDNARGILWSGGDVAGINRSVNDGVKWRANNTGQYQAAHQRVASVYQSPSNENILYYISTSNRYGLAANQFWKSTNDGTSWTPLGTTPTGSGLEAGGDRHPRQTGNLIIEDPTNPTNIVIGTSDGIYRSLDGGASFSQRAIAGRRVTSLAQDPNDTNKMYATVDCGTNPGVYELTGVFTAPLTQGRISTTLTGNGSNLDQAGEDNSGPQECVAISEAGVTALYVAAGVHGIWRYKSGSWTDLSPADMNTLGNSIWSGVYASRQGSDTYLLVGATDPVADATETAWRESLFRSLNSGTTWDDPTLSANINQNITNSSGPLWWLTTGSDAQLFYSLGKSTHDVSSCIIDDLNPDLAYISGRSGLWWTQNFTAATPEWYPCIDGLGASITRGISLDPTNQNHVAVGDVDWSIHHFPDGGTSGESRYALPSGAGAGNYHTAWMVDVDNDGNVWAALGEGDTNTGGSLDKASAATAWGGSAVWSHEHTVGTGYPTSVRTCGVIVGENASAQEVVLVVADSDGIYRRVNGGNWSQVYNITTGVTANRMVDFAWDRTGQYIWCYYPPSGLLRSDDYGATWTLIWNQANDTKYTGYLLKVPGENTLWLSMTSGLYRITNAHDGSITLGTGTISQTRMDSGVLNVAGGPIAWRDNVNHLYVHDRSTSSQPSRLMVYDGTDWYPVSGVDYSGQVIFAFYLRVDENGNVYVSTDGNGAIKGVPLSSDILGQATETDTVHILTGAKAKAFGLTTETDTGTSIGRVKILTQGQASETDTAITAATDKVKSIGLATDTETAGAISVNKTVTLGLVTETDTAQIVSVLGATTIAVGLASSTETATQLSRSKAKGIGLSTSTETSQALTEAKTLSVGLATETDTSTALGKAKVKAIGLATETDTAQAITVNVGGVPIVQPIGLATETDTAQTLAKAKVKEIGQVNGPPTATLAFDAVSNSTGSTGTINWSHVPVSTPKGLLVLIMQLNTGDDVAAVTYNGVSMTRVAASIGSGGAAYAYFLANPASGTNTVSMTTNGLGRIKYCNSISLTASGSTAIDAFAEVDTSSTNPTLPLNASVYDFVAGAMWHGHTPSSIDIGAGMVLVRETNFGLSSAQAVYRDGIVTGSTSVDWVDAVSTTYSGVVVGVKDAGATSPQTDIAQPITVARSQSVNIATETDTATALTVSKHYVIIVSGVSETDTAGTITRLLPQVISLGYAIETQTAQGVDPLGGRSRKPHWPNSRRRRVTVTSR